jgi:CelD/BcsL family acetyltransferase involved in cellulose biosynthesis
MHAALVLRMVGGAGLGRVRAPTHDEPTVIESFCKLEARRDDWSRFAERSRNIFATWEWAATWWEHYGGGASPAFRACRGSDGEVFAILPLYLVRRGRILLLRFIGHGPGDVLGPICAEGEEHAAGAALARVLAERPRRWHVFLAERIPRGPIGDAIGGTRIQTEANPNLEIAGQSWDDFFAGLSKKLRGNIRRSARQLEEEHEVRYRLCDDPARLDADLDTLMRLHAARWGAGAFEGTAGAFHRDFAHRALDAGWLRLWLMEVDGRPVAAWYGFRFGGVDAFYQSGRDQSWDRYSVGSQLLVHTIRSAFDDGISRYAFLRGDEPYKDRFANSDVGLETRALGQSPLYSALVAGGTAVIDRVPGVRRSLVRLVG